MLYENTTHKSLVAHVSPFSRNTIEANDHHGKLKIKMPRCREKRRFCKKIIVPVLVTASCFVQCELLILYLVFFDFG